MDRIENILLKSLNAAWTRHEALANNVANAETPGYIRKDIDFQSEIAKIMDPDVDGNTYTSDIVSTLTGKIQLEKEIGEITKNTGFFSSVAKITALRQRILDSTIGGGGTW